MEIQNLNVFLNKLINPLHILFVNYFKKMELK